MTSPWVVLNNGRKASKVRLICLSHAGGGTATFYRWISLLSDEIDMLRIQMPGHEARIREPLLRNSAQIVEEITSELIPFIDRPFAVYGHSMGALLAFELVRKIRAVHGLMPIHLFVSGFRAPHLPLGESPIHHLPEDQFIEKLRQYGGVPEQVLNERDLMELVLPILRADFEVLDTYVFKTEPPLDCSITAFGGLQDPKIGREMVEAWENETAKQFKANFFPGGHFFINDHHAAIISCINREIEFALKVE